MRKTEASLSLGFDWSDEHGIKFIKTFIQNSISWFEDGARTWRIDKKGMERWLGDDQTFFQKPLLLFVGIVFVIEFFSFLITEILSPFLVLQCQFFFLVQRETLMPFLARHFRCSNDVRFVSDGRI